MLSFSSLPKSCLSKLLAVIKHRFFRRGLACALAIFLSWATYIFIYGNFHQVDKDFYRSAQLFSFNMPYYVKKNEIKSILNLRGPSKDDWYKDELEIAAQNNITHFNYRIGDRKMLTKEQMDDIVAIIEKAPKPILVHCKAGADRAALATALYLHALKKDPNAGDAISIKYGHFPWLGSKTKAMDQSFEYYKQQYSRQNHTQQPEAVAVD